MPHTRDKDSFIKDDYLDTGLSSQEVTESLHAHGKNVLEGTPQKTILAMIWSELKQFLNVLLIVAAIVSILASGHLTDGLFIMAIVILNMTLAIVQERKASNAIDALKNLSKPHAKVIRSGETMVIEIEDLVVGDLVLLEAGDFVPADLRLLETVNLKIDESALTGESVSVDKDANAVLSEDTALGDRVNMGYSGTIVTLGRGLGQVVSVGMSTEMGGIAKLLSAVDDALTPLQEKIERLGKLLGTISLVAVGLVFIAGIIYGFDIADIFIISVSLAVAAIPEGLPTVITVVLAIGMRKMAQKNAIVKSLAAVETLGSVTVISTDKTGTLTQNKMVVTDVYDGSEEIQVSGNGYEFSGTLETTNDNTQWIAQIAALCNDAQFTNDKEIGDPTELALVTLAHKHGLNHQALRKAYPRSLEAPFDSDRKRMSTAHILDGQTIMFTKGAPDSMLECATYFLKDGEEIPLTDALKDEILAVNDTYAKRALRVLGYAYKKIEDPKALIDEEHDMVFVGLTGMMDPPRDEVKDAIKLCEVAGIRVVMITGDHPVTAQAIAQELGMGHEQTPVTGKMLDEMTDAALQKAVQTTRVFARVSPHHKVQIVNALRAAGEVTSMTGDGVNDAPALKGADIGVSMGITGTDVSQEASDIVLMDDNFTTIVEAVEEGRVIYANIRKFVAYLVSCNVGEVLLIFIAMILGWGSPLLAIQILWVNLVTDSFPAFALGLEPKEYDVMKQAPTDKDAPIVDRKMGVTIALQSLFLAIAVLTSFYLGWQVFSVQSMQVGQTFAFATIIVGELLRMFSARSETKTIFELQFFSNNYVTGSFILGILLLLVVLYVPGVNTLFGTNVVYSFEGMMIAMSLGILPLIGGELSKVIKRKIKAAI